MTDRDELDWREAIIDWAEQIHREVRALRIMVQVMFVVWVLGLVVGIVAVASGD